MLLNVSRRDPEDLPAPEPSEVMDSAWVRWEAVHTVGTELPELISPWLADQIEYQELEDRKSVV